MSDVFKDPVGDRLRAHDLAMRRARWEAATVMIVVACLCLAVVGVFWVIFRDRPRFATGFSTLNGMTTPWCESRDERQCPTYGPGGTVLTVPEVKR